METKESKIVKCIFTNEWKNPSGSLTYYHELTLENGDVGNCGALEKCPPKMREGSTLTYTIDEKNKIKIVMGGNESFASNLPYVKGKGYGSSTGGKYGVKKADDFLGYAWSYAKDFVIAGKGMSDVEEMNKVARYIYNEIGKMLDNK